jgi:hypothetical protein
MDKIEARSLLEEFVRGLKQKSYTELRDLVRNPECLEVRGESGVDYQIEYEAVWDSQPGGVLRIVASIDDGGLTSALFPVCDDFVIKPDGEFIS